MSVVNKYIDSNNFLTAISVYNEEALLTLATDGYYQNNGTYRRQLNGLLGPSVLCADCAEPCGESVNIPNGQQGYYNLDFSTGETVNDVGAILIYFNPQSVPDGIRVLYDNVYYNAVSAPIDGRIQSTSGVADAFTILGNPASTCVPTTPNTTSYNYFDGFNENGWITGSPTPQSITINFGDDQRGGQNQYSTLVIPKPNATPGVVNLQVLGPCSGTAWNVEVSCPEVLPSFTSTLNQGTSTSCGTASNTYYFAKHRLETNTYPIVTSWVFSDENGQNVLANGNYAMSSGDVITVLLGVVTAIQSCTP
tara:strand:- start:769 stop:1692 length:924 start_codon:yes stop_codon:yes gene_type:complete